MKKGTTPATTTTQTAVPRPPVVAIMGHIDHGKSTLLDYIRKSNIVAREAGGITQHLGAYEIDRAGRKITFLDTPGHAAFCGIRERSAAAADVAILVVSAEEGVKPQTIEAYKCIQESETPFIVAITKMDSPRADLEKTKQSLAEREIFVEGYGGSVSSVAVSGKTGAGIDDLIELILLTADIAHFTYDPTAPAEGVVIEANREERRGNAATIVIKNGTLTKGAWLSCGTASVPVRFIENDLGKQIDRATASAPVQVVGWSSLPAVGDTVRMHASRKEAEIAATPRPATSAKGALANTPTAAHTITLIVKADASGSVEAIIGELKKLSTEAVTITVADATVGDVTENDLKLAITRPDCIILGFNVSLPKRLAEVAERQATAVMLFDIIYKLTEAVAALVAERTPKIAVEEITGRAKILKVFSVQKDRQIVGGRVEDGALAAGASCKIIRRDAEVGTGKIRGLEQNREKSSEIRKGSEFGSMIESKIAIAPGDIIQTVSSERP